MQGRVKADSDPANLVYVHAGWEATLSYAGAPLYRSALLIRNIPPIGPYSSPVHRDLW